MALDPGRTVAELRELRELTGDENGAQRLAWTETWAKAREWLRAKMEELPVEVERDEAGNLWATLRGASERALVIGGHMDSVPNGGWLDGCLDTLAGLEVLRRLAGEGEPELTVRVVDWADEEGARFGGKALVGSSAAAGHLDPDELRPVRDRDGMPLPEALAAHGVDLDRAGEARRQLESAAAYIELHIEQGPVLERLGLALGVCVGTPGLERHAVRFRGQAAHAGSTPMDVRRDAFAAAGRLALEVREIAKRGGGVGTVGRVAVSPGIPSAVVELCEISLDQRCIDGDALARMLAEAREASERIAAEERVEVEWEPISRMAPAPFHPVLIELADEAAREVAGASHRLPSGPLHDATEMARAGVPTVMLFAQSLRGLSHAKEEDTRPEHLELAVRALDRLTDKAIAWVAGQA